MLSHGLQALQGGGWRCSLPLAMALWTSQVASNLVCMHELSGILWVGSSCFLWFLWSLLQVHDDLLAVV